MVSSIYASLGALIIMWLSFNVIKQRRAHKISVGDGGNENLKLSMAAQSNAVEYIPITLILMFSLEFNDASLWLLHALGLAMLVGRVVHAKGLLSSSLKLRVLGMQVTLFVLMVLIICNFLYLSYNQLFSY